VQLVTTDQAQLVVMVEQAQQILFPVHLLLMQVVVVVQVLALLALAGQVVAVQGVFLALLLLAQQIRVEVEVGCGLLAVQVAQAVQAS
jgi:hypothetical protein